MIRNAPGASGIVKPDRIEQLETQLATTVRNQQRVSADKTAQILLTAITSNSVRENTTKKGRDHIFNTIFLIRNVFNTKIPKNMNFKKKFV